MCNVLEAVFALTVTDAPGSSPDQKYARISYGLFITIRYKLKVSTYFLEPLVTGGWNRERDRNGKTVSNGHRMEAVQFGRPVELPRCE
jgi:hypothetical protein